MSIYPESKAEHAGVADGITWAVVRVEHPWGQWWCGYARIPMGHPWRGIDYMDLPIYLRDHALAGARELTYGNPDGWVGFDTNHITDHWPGNDAPDFPDAHHWIVPEVIEQARLLARDIAAAEEAR